MNSLGTVAHHWRQYWGGSSTPTTDVLTYSGRRDLKEITDVETPQFAVLKKCGSFLPINPVRILEYSEERHPESGRFTTSAYEWRGENYSPYPWTLAAAPEDPDMRDQVIIMAAANAAASDFDALTWAAEFGKTAAHLGSVGRRFNAFASDLARRAYRYSSAVRKAKRRGPWAIFQDLWLEARFAWRPYIYDVRGAVKALETLQNKYDINSGRGRLVQSLDASYDSGMIEVHPQIDKRVVETLVGERIYRGKSWCDFSSQNARAFGRDPLTTIYELTPYSFIVDYFVDVGGWVQTIIPRLSGRYRAHSYSYKTEYTLTQTVNSYGKAGATYDATPSKTVIKVREYVRWPTGIPVPPLLPQLTAARVTDIAAIFARGRADVFKILSGRGR